MSHNLRCGDPAALAGFIYDECDDRERAAMLAHLAECAACAAEVTALQGTRQTLAQWEPPPAERDFRVPLGIAGRAMADGESAGETSVVAFRPKAAADAPARWWHWAAMPAWSQAAAAVALFAVGAATAAVMNVEVRRDQAGITIRTGWFQSAPAAAPATTEVDAAVQARIREEVRRVHAEADSAKAAGGTVAVAAARPGLSTAGQPVGEAASGDTLRQMRQLVAESEQRQQRELALRVAQMVRDVDSQRRADIAKIERTVSPMEGVTSEELQQQRRMLNYLISVSQTK